MATATHAKAYRSPVRHLLVAGTKTTRCGKDATLMARFAMSDLPSGERTNGRDCTTCRDTPPRCTCGARDFESCLCGVSPRDYFASKEN